MESKKAVILGDFYYDYCTGYNICDYRYSDAIVTDQNLIQEIIDTKKKLQELERKLISQTQNIKKELCNLEDITKGGRNTKTRILKMKGWKQESVSFFSKNGKTLKMHEAAKIVTKELEEKLVDNLPL